MYAIIGMAINWFEFEFEIRFVDNRLFGWCELLLEGVTQNEIRDRTVTHLTNDVSITVQIEISFSYNSIAGDHIATKFCTFHDSTNAMVCAKFCSDHFIRIWIREKWNFHHIWNVLEKMLVKCAPVTWLTHWGRVTHICVSTTYQHCFRWWLVACLVPSHSLKQCCNIINSTLRNIFQWNFI